MDFQTAFINEAGTSSDTVRPVKQELHHPRILPFPFGPPRCDGSGEDDPCVPSWSQFAADSRSCFLRGEVGLSVFHGFGQRLAGTGYWRWMDDEKERAMRRYLGTLTVAERSHGVTVYEVPGRAK
jgi:hypothetical protein